MERAELYRQLKEGPLLLPDGEQFESPYIYLFRSPIGTIALLNPKGAKLLGTKPLRCGEEALMMSALAQALAKRYPSWEIVLSPNRHSFWVRQRQRREVLVTYRRHRYNRKVPIIRLTKDIGLSPQCCDILAKKLEQLQNQGATITS